MLNINPQYLVDDKGEKTAALLSIKEYQFLMQRLEDLEDMLEMDVAVQTETEASQAELMDYAETQLRDLCASRKLDWDAMTEADRENFVNDLIHEDRECIQ
jgi:PHD/YefM family antitoxin component YafN of YafNO toxin-antitoxin module